MSDLSRIVDEMCAWLDVAEPAIPTLPTPAEGRGNAQDHVIVDISHTSRTSHEENYGSQRTEHTASESVKVSAEGSRVTSSRVEGAGSVGSAGSGGKTLAESTLPPFLQDLEDVGSVGSGGAACGRPFLDLNHAAPQPEAAASPPGDSLPISPSDVRAGVERELRALAEDGREGPTALRDAIAITAAKIRNSEALAERQAHGGRCHLCDGPLDDSAPVVAVMTGRRGAHLHLHARCCPAYTARRIALVDQIMAAAGLQREAAGR